jgi:hypothetical protein
MLEQSDRRTGKRWRRMAEKATRHPFIRPKIQRRICGAPTLGKTLEEATHTNDLNRLPDPKITTDWKPTYFDRK